MHVYVHARSHTQYPINTNTNSALWVAPVDFLVMSFTFCVTVFWNVELGLEYGIIASVVVLLLQISKLDVDSIGQLSIAEDGELPRLGKSDTHFRPLSNYPSARQHPNVKVRMWGGWLVCRHILTRPSVSHSTA